MITFYYQIKTQIEIELQNSNKEFQLSQNLSSDPSKNLTDKLLCTTLQTPLSKMGHVSSKKKKKRTMGHISLIGSWNARPNRTIFIDRN